MGWGSGEYIEGQAPLRYLPTFPHRPASAVSSFTFADSLQVALFGLDAGEPLLRAFLDMPLVDVATVCGTSEDALARAGRWAPSARLTTDAESVLSDSTVGAVVITAHAERPTALAEAALGAGKHVLIDRALAEAAQAERLVALAEAGDRRLMVGHRSLYHPAFLHAERLVTQGGLGQIRTLDVACAGPAASRPRESALDRLAEGLAIADALLGPAVAVWAQGGAFLGDAYDVVFATAEHAGGALARLHASTLSPRPVHRMTVVGSRQSVEVDVMRASEPVRVTDRGVALADGGGVTETGSGTISIPPIATGEPERLQVEEFVAAIRKHRAPRTDGAAGVEVARALDAVRQSLAQGARAVVQRSGATRPEPVADGR